MVQVTYVAADGDARSVEAESGMTAMEAALENMVEGIVAECGGACACATCMVYVPEEWATLLPPRDAAESAMLEMSENCTEASRLSCQITLTEELDGLVLHMPAEQG